MIQEELTAVSVLHLWGVPWYIPLW